MNFGMASLKHPAVCSLSAYTLVVVLSSRTRSGVNRQTRSKLAWGPESGYFMLAGR